MNAQNVGVGTTTPQSKLHIVAPSGYTFPLLQVEMDGSASPYLIVQPDGKVGIGVANPSEVLDVSGSVQFSGALMPGGDAGTAGFVLMSQGAGNPPVWVDTALLKDNWGSQVAVTQGPIVGDGTSANPIGLQGGTNTGDILIWDGTQWVIKPSPFDSVCGTVMANYVQKWTGTELCNSLIYDNGISVGIGTVSVSSDIILELNSSNQGFLPPRVALINASLPNPLSAPPVATIVYNTNNSTSGLGLDSVYPGYYYWDGNRWVRLSTTSYRGIIVGQKTNSNNIINTRSPQYECTGATITLPPGKWLVNITSLLAVWDNGMVNNAPCYIWTRATLGEGACTPGTTASNIYAIVTPDILWPMGAVQASGAVWPGGLYGILTGSFIVNNTSGSSKTYSVWASIQHPSNCSALSPSEGLYGFLKSNLGENIMYAVPID